MRDTVWPTKDGRQLLVSQMEESHIRSCILLIRAHWPKWRPQYLERLELELDIRRLKRSGRDKG